MAHVIEDGKDPGSILRVGLMFVDPGEHHGAIDPQFGLAPGVC